MADRRFLGLSLRLWLVLLGMAVVRFAVMFGTGPVHDEAYYWSWSQRLDFGYYDQPFLIGWLLWPFVTVLGDSAWVMRLVATALTFMTSVFLALTLRALSTPSRRVANEPGFALLVVTSPVLWGVGLLYVHDTAMLCFLSLGLWLGAEALIRAPGRDSRGWWLGAGLALALAFSAKVSAALWIAGLGLGVLAHPIGWAHLRRIGPWAATAMIAGTVGLFLLWNGLNGWVTFGHIGAEHMNAEASTLNERLQRLGLMALVLLLLTGPAAVILFARFALTLHRSLVTLSLALFTLLPLLAFAGLGWTREIYPNWLLPSALGMMVLGGLFWPIKTRRWHLLASAPSALICVALLLPIMLREPRFMLANARDMLGWERSIDMLIEYRDSAYPGHGIVGNYYQLASQVAFHQDEITPSVGTDKRNHQFKLYEDRQDMLLAPLLVLTPSLEEGRAALEAEFCQVNPISPWPVNHRDSRIDAPYLFEVRRPLHLGSCE